jgi:hypothetical protein
VVRLTRRAAMYDRELQRGFWVAFWNGPFKSQPVQASSIREEETAVCLDCQVYFNIRSRTCPKCDGEQFWLISNWKKQPARMAAPVRIAVA